MAIVGSNVTIDVHSTADVDIEALQGVVRQNDRLDPALAQHIQQAIEETVTQILREEDITAFDLTVDVRLVPDRVAGAPRERIEARLDLEGENEVIAAVDNELTMPERARLADAVEAAVLDELGEHGLAEPAHVTVSVTPVQFR